MGVNFSSKAANSSETLRRLSDEVSRIATALAQLSTAPERESPTQNGEQTNRRPDVEISLEMVKKVIRARRLRSRYLDPNLFADPAWDMLLALYHAELSQIRVSVTSLCTSAEVPLTTALRWLSTMADVGLLSRRSDPTDGRRVFVELMPEAKEAMRCYCLEVSKSEVQ